jgi:predicted permease
MGFIDEWLRRIAYLLNRRRHERDLQREMEIHREMMGESARFGNTLRLSEESRDVWGWNWLDSAAQDLKFAARTLRHSPGFALGASIILGLGIGLNLTLFQIYDNVALKPFHVRGVETIVELERVSPRGPAGPVSYAAAQFIRANNNGVLSAVLTQDRWKTVLWADSEEPVSARFVSSNWFDELSYGAAQGRLFHETVDDPSGAPAAFAVSYRFWTTQLNRDPHVIGSNVRINGRPATLVGVVPEDFPIFGGHPPQVWIPIEQYDYFIPDTAFRTAWVNPETELFARLKAGISPAAAREALRPVMDDLAFEHPGDFRKGEWLEPYPATNHFERPWERSQRLLTVTGFGFLSLLVLTVACANLGNLVLSRSVGRLRELSVRIALGANRSRVMRHLLAESALLAGMGALLGLALSYVAILEIAARVELPMTAATDWRTMLAMLSGAAFAMIAVGFVPTWSVTRRDLNSAIKDGGEQASAGLGQQRLRSMLTAVQVAGSCVLLLLATLAARNLRHNLAPGMDFDKVAVFEPAGLGNAIQTLRGQDGKQFDPRLFWSEMRPAIADLPEAEETALVTNTPFAGPVRIDSKLPDAPDLTITVNDVEPQFFKLMRIPILVGRAFDSFDAPETAVIISRRLAMQVYGTLNVVGKAFPPTPSPEKTGGIQRTIVGVAEETSVPIAFGNGAEYYLPFSRERLNTARLLVRARSAPVGLTAALREAARRVDSRFHIDARLLSADYANSLQTAYLTAGLASGLSSLTLFLACLGVFSVISYGATLRRKELSVRMALGATRRSVVTLLMRQSAWPAAAGMFFGFAFSIIASDILNKQFRILGALDPLVLASAAGILSLTCGVAALLPAIQAVRGDIAQTLRND